tara:strand:- start:10 stop:201 length:192 start_codon:yes stop_codon:yes gene_type:complete
LINHIEDRVCGYNFKIEWNIAKVLSYFSIVELLLGEQVYVTDSIHDTLFTPCMGTSSQVEKNS